MNLFWISTLITFFLPCSVYPLQYDLNDPHPELIVHWAGENSDVILCMTRDLTQTTSSWTAVYISTDYGESFENKTNTMAASSSKRPIYDRFYSSKADKERVSILYYSIRHIFRESNFLRIRTSRHFREFNHSRSRRRAMEAEISSLLIIHSFSEGKISDPALDVHCVLYN